VRVGVAIFLTDRTIAPDELAREAEGRGFASLFVPEHTHMPVEHGPHPSGGPLPDEYHRTLDPVVALTAAAGATSTLELGTGVALVAQRDPIVLAKAVASLTLLAGPRVTVGVGYGWNRPELEHHGVRWEERRAVVRDRLELIRALWRDEVAQHEGTHVQLRPSWSWPKPTGGPPPILLGARLGPRTLEDLVAVADGWMPIGARATHEGLPSLRAAWDRAGRAGRPHVHVYGTRPEPEILRGLAELGVDAMSLWLPSTGRDGVLPVLDRFAALVEELR
jgi:probable F420-dependent oxidoreductase